jgi:hypothetical protein
MNTQSWLEYFQQNRANRPEPEWKLPFPEDAATSATLARSLAHFQLGESGEGTCLLADARRSYPDDPAYLEALTLFVREEQEHARLLAQLVTRFGGQRMTQSWSHALFRGLRRSFGVHFELQILAIAELVGTAYYRALRVRVRDIVLEQVCDLILRDEAAHVEFHAERFAEWQFHWLPMERAIWAAQFQIAFLGAAAIVWHEHGDAMRAVSVKRREFFHAARAECNAFLTALQPTMAPMQPAVSTKATR